MQSYEHQKVMRALVQSVCKLDMRMTGEFYIVTPKLAGIALDTRHRCSRVVRRFCPAARRQRHPSRAAVPAVCFWKKRRGAIRSERKDSLSTRLCRSAVRRPRLGTPTSQAQAAARDFRRQDGAACRVLQCSLQLPRARGARAAPCRGCPSKTHRPSTGSRPGSLLSAQRPLGCRGPHRPVADVLVRSAPAHRSRSVSLSSQACLLPWSMPSSRGPKLRQSLLLEGAGLRYGSRDGRSRLSGDGRCTRALAARDVHACNGTNTDARTPSFRLCSHCLRREERTWGLQTLILNPPRHVHVCIGILYTLEAIDSNLPARTTGM